MLHDLLHDQLEGVVPEDLLAIIRILSVKGWFTIEAYNKAMKDLSWSSYESSDKPMSVPIVRNVRKLRGKAVSMWVHIRNWPLIIRKFIVDHNEAALALGLKLHEVTERLTASEFCEYEIELVNDVIMEYLDMRQELRLQFPEFVGRPKPKHHFIR